MDSLTVQEFLKVEFNGDGYGYGDGYSYGLKSLCGGPVYMIDGVPTIITGIRGSVAMGSIVMADLSKRKTFVVKGGGKFAHGEDLHAAQAALEEKLFDDMPIEEKLEAFREQFAPGEAYTVADFYDWHHRLTGSCTQGRDAFAQDHELSMSDAMTPEEFIDLTKDAFGGRIIRQLAEYYGIDL